MRLQNNKLLAKLHPLLNVKSNVCAGSLPNGSVAASFLQTCLYHGHILKYFSHSSTSASLLHTQLHLNFCSLASPLQIFNLFFHLTIGLYLLLFASHGYTTILSIYGTQAILADGPLSDASFPFLYFSNFITISIISSMSTNLLNAHHYASIFFLTVTISIK